MPNKLKFLAAASMALAMPANAAVGFTVGIGDSVRAIGEGNRFQSQLGAAGLQYFTASNATITLTGRSPVSFEFMGSHSGPDDQFVAGGGLVQMIENTDFMSWGAISIGALNYRAGPISDWLFSSQGSAQIRGVGTSEFAIFLPRGLTAGGTYSTSELYLGFFDQSGLAGENHDDLIIRVAAASDLFTPFGETGVAGVPEPASWAMLVAGFGLVGAVRRRRRPASVAA